MRIVIKGGTIATIVGLVYLLGVAWAVPPDRHQRNWVPDRYRVECTHSSCLPTSFHQQASLYLTDLTRQYAQLGWKATANFGRVFTRNGEDYVQVIDTAPDPDPRKDGYAWVSPRCDPAETTPVAVGPRIREILGRAHMVYYFFAHELFHAIQLAYPTFDRCNEVGRGWVVESTAAEVGMQLTRKKFPHLFPLKAASGVPAAMIEREVRLDAGGRRYDVPLHTLISDFGGGGVIETGELLYYRTSSFWRHLAEVYHQGSLLFLQDYFTHRASGNDWSRWLNANLERDLGLSLGPVFALFVADYAGWGSAGRPAAYFGPDRWLGIGFTKCLEVTLTQDAPSKELTTDAQETAARCIKVRVEGLDANHRVTVRAVAVTDAEVKADQLNLGLAWSTDQTRFHCANGLRSSSDEGRLRARSRCLFVGYTGEATVHKQLVWYRAWDVVPQYARGKAIENMYVVSRISTSPSDRSHKRRGEGGDLMPYKLVFAADYATKKVAGRTSGSKTVAHLNTESVHNAQEQVPRHNKAGGQAMPIVYPHAPTTPVIPPIELDLTGVNDRKGVWLLRVTDVTVKDEGLYTESLREGSSLAVFPLTADGQSNRPLQLGDAGAFKAHIQGDVGGRAVATFTAANLEVHEYSANMLRATVTGTLCDISLTGRRLDRSRCDNPRPLVLTITKGLAGLHHPDSRFVIKDTPGTQQLRAVLTKLFADYTALSTPTTPSAGGGATGGAAAGGSTDDAITGPYDSTVHTIKTCACTCNDPHYLQTLKADLKSGRKKENPAMLRLVMKVARCMRTCTPHYMSKTCKR